MKRSCGAIVTLAMTAIAAAACSAGDSRHSPIEKGSGSASGDPSIITFWKTVPEATRLRLKGDFAGAAAIYEKALSLNPDHEDSLYYLGQCRVALGQYEEAARVFSKLIAVNPDSPRAHLGLGATLAAPDSAAPLDLAGAERHFRRAHELNAEETGPMVRLAEVLVARGEEREAMRWLLAAARSNPRSVEATFLAGYLFWKKHDTVRARDAFARAISASAPPAPVAAVAGEGDTRPRPSAAAGARPHRAGMGRTLFGDLCANLPAVAPVDLDPIYAPVRRFVEELARRDAAGHDPTGQ